MFTKVVRATVPRELRNWFRSPSRSAQWIFDSVLFHFGITKNLTLTNNCTLVCHPAAFRVYSQAQVSDPEQALEFKSFLSYCSKSMLLFDVGASFGAFSVAAARFGGKVVALDPSPFAAEMIGVQAELNECETSVKIVEATVSDTNGIVDVISSGVFSNGYFRVTKRYSKSELTPTRAITIDQLSREVGLPTHIKIDVEGHEGAVLRGAANTIRQSSPILFLELHNEIIRSEGGDPAMVFDILVGSGYGIFGSNGEPLSSSAILRSPITRVVAKRGRLFRQMPGCA